MRRLAAVIAVFASGFCSLAFAAGDDGSSSGLKMPSISMPEIPEGAYIQFSRSYATTGAWDVAEFQGSPMAPPSLQWSEIGHRDWKLGLGWRHPSGFGLEGLYTRGGKWSHGSTVAIPTMLSTAYNYKVDTHSNDMLFVAATYQSPPLIADLRLEGKLGVARLINTATPDGETPQWRMRWAVGASYSLSRVPMVSTYAPILDPVEVFLEYETGAHLLKGDSGSNEQTWPIKSQNIGLRYNW